jgi:hypothetical protein
LPTPDDLSAARHLLLHDLLLDFPFACESDRAHVVAALLLQFVRDLILGTTPIHLVESPTPGTGKGLLADLISLVFLGRCCQPTTISREEDESRKKITSLLLRGQPIILLDNVRGALESSQIASAITAETWSDRILGQSRMVDLPNRATWVVTANNPRLSLEIARRCLRIRLDSKTDRPWQRAGFRHPKLREWVLENRSRLIWALLVLVRAWIAEGRPKGDKTLGSFESYAEVVGGILGSAGIPGFLVDTEQLYEQADTEGREWREFTAVWWQMHQDTWASAGDLHKVAMDRDLLLQVLGDKNEKSQKIRLGIALRGARDRHFGNFRIESEDDKASGAARYRLIQVPSDGVREPRAAEQNPSIDFADMREPDGP